MKRRDFQRQLRKLDERSDVLYAFMQHRLRVLAPVRAIAVRNMQYLIQALEESGWDGTESEDPSPVRRWALNDLGIEDSPGNRYLLDLHLFTPVRFYAILLQAEAEYLGRFYGADIQETDCFWDETKSYRDFILHPTPDAPLGVAEVKWLEATSYALEPQLAKIDSYMRQSLAQLRTDITIFVNSLPDYESYYVRVMYDRNTKGSEEDKDAVIDGIGTEGIERLERAFALPQPHIHDLNRLVDTLIKVHPPRWLESEYELGKLHLPKLSHLQAACARASAKAEPWLPDRIGRRTSRVLDTLESYGLLFDFAGVLVNVGTVSDPRLLRGCAGLACAILVSLLEAYDSVIQENLSAVRTELPFDDALRGKVRQLRRSVFHVGTIDDEAWDDVMNGTLDFGLGIGEFLADLMSYKYGEPLCGPTG